MIQQIMNKSSGRYENHDHISRIQANLKEMKEQVSDYLKKSNNQKVPPILRARHYLILSYLNNINNPVNGSSIENLKMVKDLSSEKLKLALDNEKFEPMRDSEIAEKREKNKIVKQKRYVLGSNCTKASPPSDISCLLPNICQLKLDCQDKNIKPAVIQRRNLLESLALDLPKQQEVDCFLKQRRYFSIDINRQINLNESQQLQNSKGFRIGNKWLLHSNRQTNRQFFKEHGIAELRSTITSSLQNTGQIQISNDSVVFSQNQQVFNPIKQPPKKVEKVTKKRQLISNQLKQAIMHRRNCVSKEPDRKTSPFQIIAKQGKKNSSSRVSNIEPIAHKANNPSKILSFETSGCTPWEQIIAQPQKSQFMSVDIF